ncbi:ribosomal protein S12 methylthiotransferase accessory factor [Geothermobacter ehrlichii]|uniref:Ribosomal protein S12 methylthiotransferase accessory factor n=1 Tax=Geothermobacter ehrlichii TaxID=213224 RepID=A0A5D3WLC9_9BACT|nr:OsmC family protein [Geothermobacter ehrlichii]TYO98934.1 ribosomal protein S12 methylthiotransferase accessory factor [Geothermobacter ehrlichii]
MEMKISFPGGVAVQAEYKGFTVLSDQPESNGGRNQAPSPFDLFLASIGQCAGFFALRFCQQRQIATDGLHLTLKTERDPERKRLEKIAITIHLPDGFPDKYRQAIIKATDQCAVKRAILDPPAFEVVTE